jgi:hypothetical protein
VIGKLLDNEDVSSNRIETTRTDKPFHLLVAVVPMPRRTLETRVQEEEGVRLVLVREVRGVALANDSGVGVPPVIGAANERSICGSSLFIGVARISGPYDHGRIHASSERVREKLRLKPIRV